MRPMCEAEVLPDWLRLICQRVPANQGAPRPHRSASQIGLPRPPITSASHNLSCDLSEPMRESEFGLTDWPPNL